MHFFRILYIWTGPISITTVRNVGFGYKFGTVLHTECYGIEHGLMQLLSNQGTKVVYHGWKYLIISYLPFRSLRYETERWDSQIEGFIFRVWIWNNPSDTFTFGKSLYDIPSSSATPTTHTTTSSPDDTEDIIHTNQESDYTSEDDIQENQGSPYEWISNMVPFGHPNLGGRHLLAFKKGNVLNRYLQVFFF